MSQKSAEQLQGETVEQEIQQLVEKIEQLKVALRQYGRTRSNTGSNGIVVLEDFEDANGNPMLLQVIKYDAAIVPQMVLTVNQLVDLEEIQLGAQYGRTRSNQSSN
jgi:hypothetical protein